MGKYPRWQQEEWSKVAQKTALATLESPTVTCQEEGPQSVKTVVRPLSIKQILIDCQATRTMITKLEFPNTLQNLLGVVSSH